ncbi:MerR family transcriptional regulator [Actinomadura oligospora]|uniref:MerR family transcriptional regulator n=1 Tax=Actinomadura oligospora TaxID=111804 RepID=UPI00047B0A24|nr:MerR family transcriptional regulator [Actinomadura oligospora]
MRIGELSRKTGVNSHQLRYYETQGLLKPERGPNGYREYGPGTVLVVTQIRRLLAAGLSTQDIGYILPCATGPDVEVEPCAELIDMLRARLDGLDDRIDTLSRTRASLSDFITATERHPAPA